MSDAQECAAVRSLCYYAKVLFMEYRLTFVLIGLTASNVAKHHFKSRYVPSHFAAAYPHLSLSSLDDVAVRCMKMWFGLVMAGTGYLFLLFQFLSTCNASEIYIFLLCGTWLMVYDAHEFIRNWPTHKFGAHHLTVIMLALSLIDWQVYGRKDFLNNWTAVLLISNMGTIWIADYFHVVYKTDQIMTKIEQWKRRAVVLSLAARLVNILLLVAMACKSEAWQGTALASSLVAVHLYNAYHEVKFVWQFDISLYFSKHQVHWQNEKAIKS